MHSLLILSDNKTIPVHSDSVRLHIIKLSFIVAPLQKKLLHNVLIIDYFLVFFESVTVNFIIAKNQAEFLLAFFLLNNENNQTQSAISYF